MKTRTLILAASAITAALLTGCGGGGSSDSASAEASLQTGYFVDALIANADYDCVADGRMNKTTGPDGSFQCQNMAEVRFRLGELVLGEVAAVPADHYVFPQDLVGVPRETGVNDARVVAMAQLLQSLDTDGNPSNGITLAQEEKELLVGNRANFDPAAVPVYLDSASVPPTRTKTTHQAREHLRETVQYVAQTAAQNHAAAHEQNVPQATKVPTPSSKQPVQNAQNAQKTATTHAQDAQKTATSHAQDAQKTATSHALDVAKAPKISL